MKIESKLLVTPKEVKPSFPNWEVRGIFNPGAIRMPNKKIMLFARVAERVVPKKGQKRFYPIITSAKNENIEYKKLTETGRVIDRGRNVIYMGGGISLLTTISHLRRIRLSEDGFFVEEIEEIPGFVGAPDNGDLGVEDPRIVKIGNRYIMTYVSVSRNEGICTSLAISKNLRDWDKKGIIFRQQNKDVVIFPEKIKGEYVALHRPEGTIDFSKKSIWISHSPDLIYWGREKSIMSARSNSWGDAWIGAGAPPIKTKKGWLLFYHGVKSCKGKFYGIGAALLDLKNPDVVLARSSARKPLVSPEKVYEKKGHINNVVFPTGAVLSLDRKSILLYCGGADSVVGVKKLKLSDVLKSLHKVKD